MFVYHDRESMFRGGLKVHKDVADLSREAAKLIVAAVRAQPSMLLCAASGSSPTLTYELLAEEGRRDPALFDHLRLLKLDEWGGIAMSDAASCETYLQRHLVKPLSISTDRYISFQSEADDPLAECQRIDHELQRHGPIDLSILGLGVNGHLALNEPADELIPHAHVARLAQESLQHPMLQESSAQPEYGLTIGMAGILQSKRIILLVNGVHKREALKRLLTGRISTNFPASLLLLHPDVTLLCDRDAITLT